MLQYSPPIYFILLFRIYGSVIQQKKAAVVNRCMNEVKQLEWFKKPLSRIIQGIYSLS